MTSDFHRTKLRHRTKGGDRTNAGPPLYTYFQGSPPGRVRVVDLKCRGCFKWKRGSIIIIIIVIIIISIIIIIIIIIVIIIIIIFIRRFYSYDKDGLDVVWLVLKIGRKKRQCHDVFHLLLVSRCTTLENKGLPL